VLDSVEKSFKTGDDDETQFSTREGICAGIVRSLVTRPGKDSPAVP
jgi:hypothetical protein